MFFGFFLKQTNDLVGVRLQVLISHLWIVVVISVVSKASAMLAMSVLSVHLPKASLGPGHSLSLFLKVFEMLFRIRSEQLWCSGVVNLVIYIQLPGVIFFMTSWYFLFPWAHLFIPVQ